jgi:lysophospholipase L1-like esterase
VINSISQPQANRSARNQKLKEICDAYHVGFIENYTNLGINDLTVGVYLGSDRTHPNDKGSRLIAAHVAHELW